MYLHTYDAYIAHSFKISTDHTLVLSEIKMYNNILYILIGTLTYTTAQRSGLKNWLEFIFI